jgi:hypothetical protein
MTPGTRWSRRSVVTAGILAVGWAVALAVYLTAAPEPEDWDVYDLEHSKTYLRQMEMIGGKAAVEANEMNEWLASLWHGKRLAYTIAVGASGVALAYWLWKGPPSPP